MATVLRTSPAIKNFPKIEPELFINIPIQAGIGKATRTKPDYAEYIDVDYKPWLVIEKFRRIEQEILHGPIIKSLTHVWEDKAKDNSVFWSRKKDGCHINPAQVWYTKTNKKIIIPARQILDDDYGKNKERNDTIENIRDKFLRGYKTGRANYENLGNYYYKSHYHKELFLEIVEALGLVKKTEPKKSTVEIKAIESGFNPHVFTSREMAVSSNLYQEDDLL